jgi:nicotinamide riboside kinase
VPEPSRPGLISVVGGESTGKSTLAAALGDRLPALVVPESLRSWVERHGRVPAAAEQSEVMAEHRRSEESALLRAGRGGPGWVVSDSGPLMTAVYSIQYYDDDSLLSPALEWVGDSARVVWCQDDFPWQPDPQRQGAHARAISQNILALIFAENPGLPVLVVRGAPARRTGTVLADLFSSLSTDVNEKFP